MRWRGNRIFQRDTLSNLPRRASTSNRRGASQPRTPAAPIAGFFAWHAVCYWLLKEPHMKQMDDYLLALQRAARSHVLAVNTTLEEDKQREWLHNVYIDRVTC